MNNYMQASEHGKHMFVFFRAALLSVYFIFTFKIDRTSHCCECQHTMAAPLIGQQQYSDNFQASDCSLHMMYYGVLKVL